MLIRNRVYSLNVFFLKTASKKPLPPTPDPEVSQIYYVILLLYYVYFVDGVFALLRQIK